MSNRTVTQLGAIVLMVPLIVPLSAQNQMVKGNTYADTALSTWTPTGRLGA